MDDNSHFEDNSNVYNECSVQAAHQEWEKQYLKIYFDMIKFEKNEMNFEKILEEYKRKISLFYQGQESKVESKVETFIKYLEKQRKCSIEFNDGEMQIIYDNPDFKTLIILFHECISMLIEIESKKYQYEQFMNYFHVQNSNIRCILYQLLEELVQNTIWKQKVQLLQEEIDKNELQLAKETLQKQKIIQTGKKNIFTVLIIGAVGTGKSRLAQHLSQALSGNKNELQFKDGDDLDGVTKDLNRQEIKYGDTVIDLIDTPGCGDMEAGLNFVFQKLTSNSIKINLIIFCMNAQIIRLHRQDLCFLSIIQGIFKCNWDVFYICLNFMEQVDKQQINVQSIISSFEKRLEIRFPEKNLIIDNDYSTKIQSIKNIIDQFIKYQNQNQFTLKYIPDFRFINMRLNKYQV